MKVVEFIKSFPCYSDTIANIFYTSQRMANYHLLHLYDYGYIKRERKYAHEKYFYYTGNKRKRKQHYDLIAKTYHWILKNDYEIINYKIQHRENNIEPDMIVEIKQDNKSGIIAVEIERSNIKRTIAKYEENTNRNYESLLLISNLPTENINSDYIKIYNLNIKEL